MEDFPFLVEAIARVITQFRTDAGLSQRKLAAISGIDRVYLLQVEQGKYRPTINFLFLLARGLGIPASELFRAIEQEQKSICKLDSAK